MLVSLVSDRQWIKQLQCLHVTYTIFSDFCLFMGKNFSAGEMVMKKLLLMGEGFILLTRGYGFMGGCTTDF